MIKWSNGVACYSALCFSFRLKLCSVKYIVQCSAVYIGVMEQCWKQQSSFVTQLHCDAISPVKWCWQDCSYSVDYCGAAVVYLLCCICSNIYFVATLCAILLHFMASMFVAAVVKYIAYLCSARECIANVVLAIVLQLQHHFLCCSVAAVITLILLQKKLLAILLQLYGQYVCCSCDNRYCVLMQYQRVYRKCSVAYCVAAVASAFMLQCDIYYVAAVVTFIVCRFSNIHRVAAIVSNIVLNLQCQ